MVVFPITSSPVFSGLPFSTSVQLDVGSPGLMIFFLFLSFLSSICIFFSYFWGIFLNINFQYFYLLYFSSSLIFENYILFLFHVYNIVTLLMILVIPFFKCRFFPSILSLFSPGFIIIIVCLFVLDFVFSLMFFPLQSLVILNCPLGTKNLIGSSVYMLKPWQLTYFTLGRLGSKLTLYKGRIWGSLTLIPVSWLRATSWILRLYKWRRNLGSMGGGALAFSVFVGSN